MRVRIQLDTFMAAKRFVSITSKLNGQILIKDASGLCVNGKSLLGALHSMEFTELWCESENDIYTDIREFVVE